MNGLQDLLTGVDRRVGDALAAGVRAHHRRRLAAVGKRALDHEAGIWADDAAPPRQGNRLEVLIDGEAALGRMVDEMRRATRSVHVAGWFLSPGFVMCDGEQPVIVRNLLAELAERLDVRVLLWAGAPVPVFRPSRRMVREVRRELIAAGPIRVALDSRERPLHCHHDKLVVIDDRVAFVGGIDLTSLAGDRRDSPRHPPRAAVGWHDVAAAVEGPVVADVAAHFATRWLAVTGEVLPTAEPSGEVGTSSVQLVRTVPEHIYREVPGGSFGILEAYVRAIRSARELIHLESQYLWSPEIAELL